MLSVTALGGARAQMLVFDPQAVAQQVQQLQQQVQQLSTLNIAPPLLLPPARSGGRPRTVDLRAVVDAILFIASSGCQWRMLPKDFPPRSTVQGYFYDWRDSRLWETINQLLVMSARELEGREASPTAGVIDSQSVKTPESGGTCGFDAGKKVNGRKRHIVTDTLGLMLLVLSMRPMSRIATERRRC